MSVAGEMLRTSEMLHALTPLLPPVIDAAAKGAAVIAIAAIVAQLLRHRSAASRHMVWSAAMVAQLALPLLTVALPAWRVPLIPAPAWVQVDRTAAVARQADAPVQEAEKRPSADAGSVPASSVRRNPRTNDAISGGDDARSSTPPSMSVTAEAAPILAASRQVPWLTALWVAGVLAILLRLAVGTASVARLARSGMRIEDGAWLSLAQRLANRLGIERPLTLLRGDRLGVPVTWGVVYPVVLLPAEADEWTEERRQLVLVHEMAHVKRFDALTQLVAQFTLALFWFNPLVWIAARRMRAEREHACDDYVLREGTKASLYADELLGMVRSLGTANHDSAAPAFAALAMARRSEFEGRMLAILDPRANRRTLGTSSLATAMLALALLVLPLAAMQPFTVASTPASVAVAETPANAGAGRAASTAAVPAPVTAAPVEPRDSGESQSMFGTLNITRRSCAGLLERRGHSRSINQSTDDDGNTIFQYYSNEDGRCVHAIVEGRLAFTEDERDVARLEPGHRAFFRERTENSNRALTITRGAGPDQTLARVYEENGETRPWDASGRSWLARILPQIIRNSGINAKERVARFRARGGVPAVLGEIALIESSSAQRTYYEALLEMGALPDNDLDLVVRQAGRDLSGSSGDLSAVLKRVPTANRVAPAVQEAVKSVTSDGDRRSVLSSYLQQSPDRELMLTVLKATGSMTSDGDKAAVLIRAAPAAALAADDSLRAAYFKSARSLTSDGDRSRVLLAAVEHGGSSDAVIREVVRAIRGMSSDGDRKRVLLGAVRAAGVRPAATSEILAATKSISSPGDKATVLIEVAERGLLTTPEARAEFASAARAISSDGDFRRVMDALLRVNEAALKKP